MPWIQSHTNVERHRKTLAVADDLNAKPVHISGHLHALWHEALEQQEDGNLEKWSNRMIARLAQWDGDADQFVAALREHGLLDGPLIHDWLDYAWRYLQAKYRTSDPQKLQRIRDLHSSQTKDRLESDLRQTEGGLESARTNIVSYGLSDTEASVEVGKIKDKKNSEKSKPGAKRREPVKPAVPWPDPFVITENLRRWAQKEQLPTPESEVDAFHDWAIAKDARFSDWEAAFRTRLRNTRKFGSSTGNGGVNRPNVVDQKIREALEMTYPERKSKR